jgi:serralysin
VAIQADGKIVVAGDADFERFALSRYKPDGRLDSTFGGDGKVRTSFPGGSTAAAFAVAIQADGKIVAAGWSFTGPGVGKGVFTLVRYNRDGMLDSSFGADGRVRTNFLDGDERVHGVVIQADGKIVAAGWAEDRSGDDVRFALARYNADGTLDATFDADGRVLTSFAPHYDEARASALTIQADGKLVVAGEVSASDNPGRFALARYNADGTLDATFSGNGKVTTNFHVRCSFECGSDGALDVAIQTDGKIVAVGFANSDRFALVRYRTNGRRDRTFSGDGRATTNFSGAAEIALGAAIQASGKIVVAGSASRHGGTFALARYNLNGRLDQTFSGDGRVTTNFTRGDDGASDVATRGKRIVAVGWAGGLGGRFAVARYRGG